MEIQLKRINQNYHFELENQRGHKVYLDSNATFGGNDLAPSPMELLLMGVAGCSAIDILSILKKQRQQVTNYTATVKGTREAVAYAKPFKAIQVIIYLQGDILPDLALKAADLSFAKYCSVTKTLEPTANVTYVVFLNDKQL